MTIALTPRERTRLFRSIVPPAAPEDCRLWVGRVTGQGYGQVTVAGKHALVHRVMWVLERGQIPDGMSVIHLCANAHCCNTAHLTLNAKKRVVGRSRAEQQARRQDLARRLDAQKKRPRVTRKIGSLAERLLPHIAVITPDRDDACWEWTRKRNACGYGSLGIGNGRSSLAHREMWRLLHGSIPAGTCVCHTCDNPACCRPSHLWLGTPGDNARDRDQKGRLTPLQGEAHGMAKLTEAQVTAIRAADGSHSQLARDYGVTPVLIRKIRTRELWAHV